MGASVVGTTGGLPVATRTMVPRLTAVVDLWPSVLLIRDGSVEVVVEDNAFPDK